MLVRHLNGAGIQEHCQLTRWNSGLRTSTRVTCFSSGLPRHVLMHVLMQIAFSADNTTWTKMGREIED